MGADDDAFLAGTARGAYTLLRLGEWVRSSGGYHVPSVRPSFLCPLIWSLAPPSLRGSCPLTPCSLHTTSSFI
jgi:hypothetical protein